jgi:hypothetical protein
MQKTPLHGTVRGFQKRMRRLAAEFPIYPFLPARSGWSGVRSGASGLYRRHRPAIGLAQSSRRYPRLVLSERIHPENRLTSSGIPYEPVARTKRSSSVAVGIVRLAGHVARFYSR